MNNIIDFTKAFIQKETLKPTIIFMYMVLALSLWKYIPAAERLADLDGHLLFETDSVTIPLFFMGARKLWSAFLLMGVFPWLIIRFVFREDPTDYGLCWGNRLRTIRTFLMLLPVMLGLGYLSGFDQSFYVVYPYNPYAGGGPLLFWIHAVMYLFLYYLAWEFMFRGFVQHGLEPTCGPTNAVLIQVVATAMLHYGHPGLEVLGTIGGGLLWGFLVYRTQSIFSGWWQHALLGISLDYFLIHEVLHSTPL